MKNQLPKATQPDVDAAESTLRLIASLPAPDGLEDRIQAALKAAPRPARILQWPSAFRPGGNWMRSAAAAAIVFVVAGGGWGVYSRVQPAQPSQPAHLLVMPPHAGAAAGFSSAGAMRTPQTLTGPVVAPAAAQVKAVKPVKPAVQAKKLRPLAAQDAESTGRAEPAAR